MDDMDDKILETLVTSLALALYIELQNQVDWIETVDTKQILSGMAIEIDGHVNFVRLARSVLAEVNKHK